MIVKSKLKNTKNKIYSIKISKNKTKRFLEY